MNFDPITIIDDDFSPTSRRRNQNNFIATQQGNKKAGRDSQDAWDLAASPEDNSETGWVESKIADSEDEKASVEISELVFETQKGPASDEDLKNVMSPANLVLLPKKRLSNSEGLTTNPRTTRHKVQKLLEINLKLSREEFQQELGEYIDCIDSLSQENIAEYLQESMLSLFSFSFGSQNDSYGRVTSPKSTNKFINAAKTIAELETPEIFCFFDYEGFEEDISDLESTGLDTTPLLKCYQVHKTEARVKNIQTCLRYMNEFSPQCFEGSQE